jgi:hypothetical protein
VCEGILAIMLGDPCLEIFGVLGGDRDKLLLAFARSGFMRALSPGLFGIGWFAAGFGEH